MVRYLEPERRSEDIIDLRRAVGAVGRALNRANQTHRDQTAPARERRLRQERVLAKLIEEAIRQNWR